MTEMNTAEIKGNGLQLSGTDYKPTAAIEAMKRMSKAAQECGVADMTLEEINAEISAVRRNTGDS